MQKADEKGGESFSPMLDLIFNGGSSRTLDLLGSSASSGRGLFRMDSLNKTIIFKCPNFQMQSIGNVVGGVDPRFQTNVPSASPGAQKLRPVDTGIYIPHDLNAPKLGGLAIYLRQKGYRKMLCLHLGLNEELDRVREALAYDYQLLQCIDAIPSLDPFLLSVELRKFDSKIDMSRFPITPAEIESIKGIIYRRLEPILRKAIPSEKGSEERTIMRFMNAIWNPDCMEAGMFVAAFGIEKDKAADVFDALKGISYFEYVMGRIRKGWLDLDDWLRSDDNRPADWRARPEMHEPITMIKVSVARLLRDVVNQGLHQFREYAASVQKMINEGDPSAFRRFLLGANAVYWSLGLHTSMLSNAALLHQTMIAENPSGRPGCDAYYNHLKRINSVLNASN